MSIRHDPSTLAACNLGHWKSVLCSTAVEDILQSTSRRSGISVTWFYSGFEDLQDCSAKLIVRCL